uniref:Uncharacterized protein n=1 Tax=Ditylenchus dipsaci TaxID=166011 RepID=A0A915E6M0_9BILA
MLSAKQQLSGSNQPSRSSPSEERNESLKDAARSVSEYAEKSLATEMDFQPDACASASEYAEKSLAAKVPSTNNETVKSKDQVVEIDFQPDACACASEYADKGLAANSAQKKQVKGSAAGRSALRSQNVVFGNPISAEVLVRRSQQLFLVPAGNDGLQTALPSAFDEMTIANIPNSAAQMNFVNQCLAKMKLFLGAEFLNSKDSTTSRLVILKEDNDLKTALHAQSDSNLITSVELLSGLKRGLLDSDLITSVED